MYEDRADAEAPAVERGFFQKGHYGQDGVVTAEVVVESEFVDETVAVLFQELYAVAAAARDPRGPGQWPEVVYAEDDGRWGGQFFFHPSMVRAGRRLAQGRDRRAGSVQLATFPPPVGPVRNPAQHRRVGKRGER
ncbi:hypothetical protein ACFWFU_17520 [Streptomyces sp. NPDC060235]|uniref:hypothetical protein n=1 Tax=unclassified Streptomyces TaxID=2593676 RepID=UPI0036514008